MGLKSRAKPHKQSKAGPSIVIEDPRALAGLRSLPPHPWGWPLRIDCLMASLSPRLILHKHELLKAHVLEDLPAGILMRPQGEELVAKGRPHHLIPLGGSDECCWSLP